MFFEIFFISLLSFMNINWRQKNIPENILGNALSRMRFDCSSIKWFLRNSVLQYSFTFIVIFEISNSLSFVLTINFRHIFLYSESIFKITSIYLMMNYPNVKFSSLGCHLCWYALDTSTFREALVSYLNLKHRQFYERNFF